MPEKLWEPSSPDKSALGKLQAEKGLDYWALHRWSIEHPGDFWSKAWDDLGLIGDKGDIYFQNSERFIDAKFFPNGRINVAENLLTNSDNGEKVAIVSILEDETRTEITYDQLRERSAACAAAMRELGIKAGDRVVAWAPNVPEVMIFALVVNKVFAIVEPELHTIRQVSVEEPIAVVPATTI